MPHAQPDAPPTAPEPISLVLLPGLDGTGVLFRPLVALLPAHIRPIVVTYPADRQLTYEQLLPLVLTVLPKEEPFILFGESFGGPLAIMAAATRPDNLRGLILCVTFVTPPLPMLSWLVPTLARGWFLRLFPRKLLARLGVRFKYKLNLSGLLKVVHSIVSPEMIAFRIRDLFHVDVRQKLAGCTLPMMYIAASWDVVVPVWNCRAIVKIKPDIKVVRIRGSHLIVPTRAAEVLAAIEQFVGTLRTGYRGG